MRSPSRAARARAPKRRRALATAQPVRRSRAPAGRRHAVATTAPRPQAGSQARRRSSTSTSRRSEVRFALDVKNVGNKHAELDFPSGQSYDFIVVDSIGREVWRWANGRMFTQSVQNKQLGAGESMRIAEAWTPQAGRYTAIATLNSSNYPVEQRAEFVVRSP